MPKRLTITPHLSVDDLAQRYRQARHPIERSHYQIIWLLAQGKRSEDVADVTGYSRNWIYELVRDYNAHGPQCLGDGRRENPGAPPLLTEEQQALLLQVLRGEAPDGGLWNGRKVADYLSELLDQPISRQQGWVYLRQLGWRLRVPRPQHQEADLDAQDAWKKNSRRTSSTFSRPIPTPTSRCGVRMSIAWGCVLSSGGFGSRLAIYRPPSSTGNGSGFGYMVLSDPKRARRIGGFCLMSELTSLAQY